MTRLAIYLEGGGNGAESKALLRRGMGEFLRELRSRARAKSLRWKIVACGGRDRAFQAFRDSVLRGDTSVSVLLVDAEGPLSTAPKRHLAEREGWDLRFVSEREVQLMVQAMETWIVADPTAVAAYYGSDFAGNVLPGPDSDLEALDRHEIQRLLARSTRRTRKRKSRKIRDGSALLTRIDPAAVQGRCPSCRRLFDTSGALISEAWIPGIEVPIRRKRRCQVISAEAVLIRTSVRGSFLSEPPGRSSKW